MAISDYRVKINNIKVPNTYISRGTYSLERPLRIAETYEDASGIKHEITFASKKTKIKFTLREHSSDEHNSFAALLATVQNVSVSYWDDQTNSYLSGTFRIKDFTWSHMNIIGSSIEYGPTSIELEEY